MVTAPFAISLLGQKSAQAIAHRARLAFLQRGKAEPFPEAGIRAQNFPGPHDPRLKLVGGNLSVDRNVLVGVVSDAVARRAPSLEHVRSVIVLDRLADSEQKSASFAERVEDALFGFHSPLFGNFLPPYVVHCDGDTGPGLRERWSGAKRKG